MIILYWLLGLLGVSFLLIVFRGAPYVPTHAKDIEALFGLYSFKKSDILVDLGSGDGRVLAAAARHGIRSVGYELNPFLAVLSKARLAKLTPRPEVKIADFWTHKLPSETAVVFVFLAKPFMQKLDAKLAREATRLGHDIVLISYGMQISGREPDTMHGAMVVYRYKA